MSCYLITMGALPKQEQRCKKNSDAVSTGVIADTSLGTTPEHWGNSRRGFFASSMKVIILTMAYFSEKGL